MRYGPILTHFLYPSRYICLQMQSLRIKILLGYGLTLVLVAAVMLWAFLNLRVLGRASEAILSENYQSILAAQKMIDAIGQQDSALLLYLLGYRREAVIQFAASEGQFLPWLGRARDNITIEGEEQIVVAISRSYQEYLQAYLELTRLYGQSPTQALEYYHSNAQPTFSVVRDATIQLQEINQKTMFAASTRAKRIASWAAISTIGIGGTAILLGLVFSLVLSSLITRPVRKLSEATQKIAEGSYELRIETGSKDELGRLAESFNAMVGRLQSYNRLNIGKIVEEKRKNDALIRSIDDGILLINDQLQVTNMNPAAERMFDRRFIESNPQHFLELIGDTDFFALVKKAVRTGKFPAFDNSGDTLTIERDGLTRHYQFSLTPVLSPKHTQLGMVLLFRDITRLKEIDRLKDEFMMTASHELKTPLTGIAMSIGLLRESLAGRIDKRDVEMLEVAETEVGRLRSLVSDLLDLSKIESGNIALKFESIPAETLVEKACALFTAQAVDKSIHLGRMVEEQTGVVTVDADKISWVLSNLIANALRYTRPEGHIDVRSRRAGGFIYFSVADDGAGIPPEFQSKIFDKFVRLDSDGSEGGTGLGLTICREIVRAHGGTIWVDSEVGKGSVFTFTIPVERSA
jgi:NtrC-family two-component system sensor histidine kinase KinB